LSPFDESIGPETRRITRNSLICQPELLGERHTQHAPQKPVSLQIPSKAPRFAIEIYDISRPSGFWTSRNCRSWLAQTSRTILEKINDPGLLGRVLPTGSRSETHHIELVIQLMIPRAPGLAHRDRPTALCVSRAFSWTFFFSFFLLAQRHQT
jgi:hypothetical protein